MVHWNWKVVPDVGLHSPNQGWFKCTLMDLPVRSHHHKDATCGFIKKHYPWRRDDDGLERWGRRLSGTLLSS